MLDRATAMKTYFLLYALYSFAYWLRGRSSRVDIEIVDSDEHYGSGNAAAIGVNDGPE